MKDHLREAFTVQAGACAALGSPFMERLLFALIAVWQDDGPLDRMFAGFSGDLGARGHSLPLRLAGGLHALVLSGGDADLAAVYPPHVTDDAALARSVGRALEDHEAFLLDWMESPPQTNEVRRSVALMPAARVAVRVFDRPVVLSELGASGGLNLMWDRYAIDGPGWRAGPDDATVVLRPGWEGRSPPEAHVRIAERRGVDLRPVDGKSAEGRLRLLSYLWADQPDRIALTEAALGALDAPIDRGDAIAWLAGRLAHPKPGHLHLVQHSIAWQYFPPEAQAEGTRLIEEAGARATSDSPLGWIAMEADEDIGRGAALTLRLWPGDLTLPLGRVDFHGRWMKWEA